MLFDGDFRYVYVFVVWFFGFCNAAELCEVVNETIVLPICTSAIQTGNKFVIRTSNLTSTTLACNCYFGMNPTFENVDIDFEVIGGAGCGLIFSVPNNGYTCSNSGTITLNDTDYWSIYFGNKGTEVSVCLKIFKDNLKNQSDSLTCKESSQTMSSSIVSQNTDIKVPTITEAVTVRTTTETSSEGHPFTLARTTTVTTESKRNNNTKETHGDDYTETNTGLIAAAAGGCAAFLLVVCVCIIICCCRYRKKKSNEKLSLKHHDYASTDLEVTYNVAYNMVISNGTQLGRTQLQDNAVIYNVLDEDVEPIPQAIHRPLSYENVLMNDAEVNYDNFESGDEQQASANLTAVEIEIPHIYEGDERLYDSVPLEESTSSETTTHDETGLKSTIQYEISNEIKDSGQTEDHGDNTDIFIYEHNRDADVTYATENPTDPVNKENDRPKQTVILESDDTYATVNRITTE